MPNDSMFDPAMRDKVMAMDDAGLGALIRSLAMAGGVNAKKAERLSRDTDGIRRKLASLKEEDIRRLLTQVDADTLDTLRAQVEQRKRDG